MNLSSQTIKISQKGKSKLYRKHWNRVDTTSLTSSSRTCDWFLGTATSSTERTTPLWRWGRRCRCVPHTSRSRFTFLSRLSSSMNWNDVWTFFLVGAVRIAMVAKARRARGGRVECCRTDSSNRNRDSRSEGRSEFAEFEGTRTARRRTAAFSATRSNSSHSGYFWFINLCMSFTVLEYGATHNITALNIHIFVFQLFSICFT